MLVVVESRHSCIFHTYILPKSTEHGICKNQQENNTNVYLNKYCAHKIMNRVAGKTGFCPDTHISEIRHEMIWFLVCLSACVCAIHKRCAPLFDVLVERCKTGGPSRYHYRRPCALI